MKYEIELPRKHEAITIHQRKRDIFLAQCNASTNTVLFP